MVSRRVLSVVFAAAISVSGRASFAQEAEPSPWGYLYVFRTMHLFPLTLDESRIGRLTENEIVLTSERVSRRHAAVRRTENGAELVDVELPHAPHAVAAWRPPTAVVAPQKAPSVSCWQPRQSASSTTAAARTRRRGGAADLHRLTGEVTDVADHGTMVNRPPDIGRNRSKCLWSRVRIVRVAWRAASVTMLASAAPISARSG